MQIFSSRISLLFIGIQLFALASASNCLGQEKKLVALLCGEPEYKTAATLPKFFKDQFKNQFEVKLIRPKKDDKNDFVGIEKIRDADILILSVHRRTLPEKQLSIIKEFAQSKKPILAIRTATHGFHLRKKTKLPEGHKEWRNFDQEILGCHYQGHEPSKSTTNVKPKIENRLLKDVEEFQSKSWLYRVKPLSPKATVLLQGKSSTGAEHPVAWKLIRPSGGTVICTTLGHPEDFKDKNFVIFLKNAVLSFDKPIKKTNQTTRRSDQTPGQGC